LSILKIRKLESGKTHPIEKNVSFLLVKMTKGRKEPKEDSFLLKFEGFVKMADIRM